MPLSQFTGLDNNTQQDSNGNTPNIDPLAKLDFKGQVQDTGEFNQKKGS